MTIPHPSPPIGNVQLTAARRVLAELPVIDGIERPHYWLGRLAVVLRSLADVAKPGGMDTGQREVLGQALADAIKHRTPGICEECDVRPEGLCDDHAADLDLTDAYIALGRELGIDVDL